MHLLLLLFVYSLLSEYSPQRTTISTQVRAQGTKSELELVCRSPEDHKIATVTQAFTKQYVFTATHVFRFEKFKEYDWKTNSFLRLSDDYPKKISDSFPKLKNSQVLVATVDDSNDLVLKSATKWHYFNSSFDHLRETETLENVKSIKEIKGNITDLISITRYKDPETGAEIHLSFRGCNAKKAACFEYRKYFKEKWTKLEPGKVINELVFANDNIGNHFYSFIITESRKIEEMRNYTYRIRPNLQNAPISRNLDQKMFFGCPPSFCEESFVDALLRTDESTESVLLFYGHWHFTWNFNGLPNGPKMNKEHRCKVWNNLDAAFYDSQNEAAYFFKDLVFGYCTGVIIEKTTSIVQKFQNCSQSPAMRVDAAFFYDRSVFIFSDRNLCHYWRDDHEIFNWVSTTPITDLVPPLKDYANAAEFSVKLNKVVIVTRLTAIMVPLRTIITKATGDRTEQVIPLRELMRCSATATTTVGPSPIFTKPTSEVTDTDETDFDTTTKKSFGWEIFVVLSFIVGGIMALMVVTYVLRALLSTCSGFQQKDKSKNARPKKKGYAFPAKPLPQKFFKDIQQQNRKPGSNGSSSSEQSVDSKKSGDKKSKVKDKVNKKEPGKSRTKKT